MHFPTQHLLSVSATHWALRPDNGSNGTLGKSLPLDSRRQCEKGGGPQAGVFLKLMGPLGLELISYIYIIMSFALELLWSQILQLGYANLFLEMLESLDKIQLLEDVFVFFPARPHPMVLPHKLIPYLWSKGLWPHHKPGKGIV